MTDFEPFLILKPSKIDVGGVGVFTLRDIKKDERVPLFFQDFEVKVSEPQGFGHFCVYYEETQEMYGPKNFHSMDIGCYLNDNKVNANITKFPVGHKTFLAVRDISAGEELTINYDEI